MKTNFILLFREKQKEHTSLTFRLIRTGCCLIILSFIIHWKAISQDIDRYIQNNKLDFNVNDTFSILNVLDRKTLDSTRLFVVGESHGVYFNDSIKYSLFRSLYYNANVRIVFEEKPSSYIYFVQ